MFRLYYVDATKTPDTSKLFLGGLEIECKIHKYYVKSDMDIFLEMGVVLTVEPENLEDVRYCPEELISASFKGNFLYGFENQKDRKFEMFLRQKNFLISEVTDDFQRISSGFIWCSKFYDPISINLPVWPSNSKKYAISKEWMTGNFFFFVFRNERGV